MKISININLNYVYYDKYKTLEEQDFYNYLIDLNKAKKLIIETLKPSLSEHPEINQVNDEKLIELLKKIHEKEKRYEEM